MPWEYHVKLFDQSLPTVLVFSCCYEQFVKKGGGRMAGGAWKFSPKVGNDRKSLGITGLSLRKSMLNYSKMHCNVYSVL